MAVRMQAGAPNAGGALTPTLEATRGCRKSELGDEACRTPSLKVTGLCPSTAHASDAAPVGLRMQRSGVDDDVGSDPGGLSQTP